MTKKEQNWQDEQLIDLLNGVNGDLTCEMLDWIKENIVKSGKDKIYDEVGKCIDNENLMQEIVSLVDYAMQPFYACEVIKKNNMDDISVRMLFDTIFTKGIVRYDMDMFRIHDSFNLDEDSMTRIADAFINLAFKGVSLHYSRETMEYTFTSETCLDKKYASMFGELYERYYKELQMNYIIENLDKNNDK